MKKLVIVALALALSASTAFAQAEAGDVGIYADPAGSQSTIVPAPFTPFLIYVIGSDLPGDVAGYEFTVTIPDPTLLVIGTVLNPATAVNIGAGTNFIVGTGSCLPAAGQLSLVTLTIFPQAPAYVDVAVCLAPSTPASLTPAVPAYLTCDSQITRMGVAQNGEGVYPDGCLIVGPTVVGPPVATEASSFGEIKARF